MAHISTFSLACLRNEIRHKSFFFYSRFDDDDDVEEQKMLIRMRNEAISLFWLLAFVSSQNILIDFEFQNNR